MKLIVVGTGGLAREFATWFADDVDIVGFYSSNPDEHKTFGLRGQLFHGKLTTEGARCDLMIIAIGSCDLRQKLAKEMEDVGFRSPTLIHKSSIISSTAVIGDGSVICPNCIISSNVSIGRHCYINFSCGIGHDSVIEDFVQVNPGVQVGGKCCIAPGTLIGSGSTILQKKKIGKNVTVGSGSVVFSSIKDGQVVLGNPARRIRTLEQE